MNKILDIKSLSIGYENKIVIKDISLEVFKEDFIGIIGPNGGGKTTLLKTIIGLIKPLRGTIAFYHENQVVPKINIGYLPQINNIDKKFPISVFDVIASGLMYTKGLKNRLSKEDMKQIKEIIDITGISVLIHRPIGELSGGQLQRVFLSRAIVSSPDLLILDEPSTYVDNNFENEIYQLLIQLNKKMPIIMVSHDVGIISSYVKSIACVNQTLYYHPSNQINTELLKQYNCPFDLLTHGSIPHRVLINHSL